MRVHAATWTGAQQAIPMQAGFAEADRGTGLGLKMAAYEHEFQQRNRLNAILRSIAERRRQEKAAKEAEKGSWGGLAGTGAGIVGGLLAAPTMGVSALAGAALGGGLGAGVGGGIDQAMGRSGAGGAQLGSSLTDFATEFLPTMDNPWLQAAYSVPAGGHPGQAVGLGS